MSLKPNLDLLRSMAVLYVVFDHNMVVHGLYSIGHLSLLWLGVAGVYIFFVHTSLVLMWSLERKPHTLDFYIRRVFRIYPLAWIAIASVLLFHAPVMGFFQYPSGARPHQILACFALIQNLDGGVNLLGVLWSLPLEVQMYLFLPALFFFIRKNFSLWPILLIWTFVVAFAHHEFASERNVFGNIVPDFLPGVMAYVAFRRRRPTLPGWLFPAFVLVLTALFLLKPNAFRGWIFCLALGLALPSFRQIRASWLIRSSHEVAKYSYGIYLSHSFALVLGFYLLPGKPLALQLTVELAAVAVLSITAYHLIEKPMIHLGSRLANRAEARYQQAELEAISPPHTL